MGWLVVVVFALPSVGCIATSTWDQGGVHHVAVQGGASASQDEVIAGWHARAAEICGDASYEVVSTLADDSPTYREGGRFDENGRVMRVPAIKLHKRYAEGLVRCVEPAGDAVAEGPMQLSADACRAGDAAACVRAANGRRAAGDEPRALTWLSKACRSGDAPSCIEVGASLEARGALDRDLELAAEFYKQGCKLGADEACESFARTRAAAIRPQRTEGP